MENQVRLYPWLNEKSNRESGFNYTFLMNGGIGDPCQCEIGVGFQIHSFLIFFVCECYVLKERIVGEVKPKYGNENKLCRKFKYDINPKGKIIRYIKF